MPSSRRGSVRLKCAGSSSSMEQLADVVKAWRRQQRYHRHQCAHPYSPRFKAACVHLWRLQPTEQLLGPFANWWQIRFRKCVGQLEVPSAATVAGWCADPAVVPVPDPTQADWDPHCVHATLFVLEWETSVWLTTQNAKGIAVPTHMVVEHYLHKLRSIAGPPPWVARVLGPFGRRGYHNKWMGWFRARWGIKWKRIPMSNAMPQEETLRKASALAFPAARRKQSAGRPRRVAEKKYTQSALPKPNAIPPRAHFWVPFPGPFLGPPLAKRNMRGPISGTRFGPIFGARPAKK